jgi:hypothetical protein
LLKYKSCGPADTWECVQLDLCAPKVITYSTLGVQKINEEEIEWYDDWISTWSQLVASQCKRFIDISLNGEEVPEYVFMVLEKKLAGRILLHLSTKWSTGDCAIDLVATYSKLSSDD